MAYKGNYHDKGVKTDYFIIKRVYLAGLGNLDLGKLDQNKPGDDNV